MPAKPTYRLLAAAGFALLLAPTALAQDKKPSPFAVEDPLENPATPAKIELGRYLFESPLLSRNRLISCATCHDPAKSFADGLPESRGIFESEVGRNSPTLIAIGLHPGFSGTEVSKEGTLNLLSLEERCVSPIENPVEMGSSLDEAVATLRAVPGLRQRFDEAFGRPGLGVQPDRVGKALAAFLRSSSLPDTPFSRFAEGDYTALRDEEMRGLSLFRGHAKCAECHSGPYLSDGRHQLVAPVDAFRTTQQRKKSALRAAELAANEAEVVRRHRDEARAHRTSSPLAPPKELHKATGGATGDRRGGSGAPRSGGYPPSGQLGGTTPGIQAQTPTLWDVARTGPYFRDGSVNDLEVCVRQHIAELQGTQAPRVLIDPSSPVDFMAGCGVPAGPQFHAKIRSNFTAATFPTPPDLQEQEIQDIVAFLRTLSPRAARGQTNGR